MKIKSQGTPRRWLVPEVVQTSAMDCGPASLKCLLEGYGIPVSYGRLREACQTDIDGTSIDMMEEVARELGLEAEQIMIPADHLLLPEARVLPAIVVVRLPDGNTHFVVAWRHHHRFIQIMDPATGRRWPSVRSFLSEVYVHSLQVPAASWREWAGSEEFIDPLRQRLAELGVSQAGSLGMIEAALANASWRSFAALDAATRMINSLVCSGGLKIGSQASQVLARFFEKSLAESPDGNCTIPPAYWSVRPSLTAADEEQLLLRGAVLVRALRPLPADQAEVSESQARKKSLSPELVAALAEAPIRPGRELFRLLFQEGLKNPALVLAALFATAVCFVMEVLVFRSLIEVWEVLNLPSQRLGAMAILILFALGLLLIQIPNIANLLRFGRRLELRLRVAFLEKIPRLGDRYFQSRPVSDMAQRGHLVHYLRQFPHTYGNLLRAFFELGLTVIGIAWINPTSAPLAMFAAALAVGVPVASLPLLLEQDMRMRTHSGALGRFYLDALLGLVAIRNHGAERAIRGEHEGLLVAWAHANLGFYRTLVLSNGMQALIGFSLAAWILFDYLGRAEETSWALLLAYWALNLPVIGEGIGSILQQYPAHRNNTLRLLEPLGAREEKRDQALTSASAGAREEKAQGVALALHGVSVRVAGHTILQDLDFTIAPGRHVAIVGPSGAGKSSLVGIFLGWYRPVAGQLLIDGEALTGEGLNQLRKETAWVDPAVQLWNRSLFDNLYYGTDGEYASPLGMVIEQADLIDVLQKLPEGLQTPLGEGGGLVSGGEGQRVRLGRALLRSNVRLVILDEPFRGLDRGQRRALLAQCREFWKNATLLCITHDVGETLSFDRVLVVENGRIADDGIPQELAQRTDSRYHGLLQAENAVREQLWSSELWRKEYLGTTILSENGIQTAHPVMK